MALDPELQRQIANACRPDRLFPIRSNKYYGFYAGSLPDGRQVCITLNPQNALRMHFFDHDGNFLRVELATGQQFTEPPEEPFLSVNDIELYQWLAERHGFSPGLIRVKQFDAPDAGFDIELFPGHFQDFIDGGTMFTESERERYPEYIRKWCQDHAFVLNFNNDYWLDDSGEVTSS